MLVGTTVKNRWNNKLILIYKESLKSPTCYFKSFFFMDIHKSYLTVKFKSLHLKYISDNAFIFFIPVYKDFLSVSIQMNDICIVVHNQIYHHIGWHRMVFFFDFLSIPFLFSRRQGIWKFLRTIYWFTDTTGSTSLIIGQ